jgi:membrane associated rhomboid family serine protease
MDQEPDKKQHSIFVAIAVGFLFTLLPWMVFIYEWSSLHRLSEYGVLPRTFSHWYGIFTMPFLHADWQHLLGNTAPLFILTSFLFYFYQKQFGGVFLFIYVLTGFWTWLIGRPDIHIGASGIIYGLTAYIFFSGAWSKNYRLASISLLVVFLYGSIIWGVFPLQKQVSWEGHLSGFMAGFIMSIYYRKELPKPKKFEWEISEDDSEYVKVPVEEIENGITITRFIYVPKSKVINLEEYEPNGLDRNQ